MGAHKKCIPPPDIEKKAKPIDHSQNIILKAEIERMKKLINEKIKSPDMAKKAAQIISEMLNSKKE
jgi:hypothetical protein